VGSALNSTSKENINKVVALPQSTNFGNVCLWHKADIPARSINVRVSNRPIGVKRFQTVRGLARTPALACVLR
jgi:hypothetical protein